MPEKFWSPSFGGSISSSNAVTGTQQIPPVSLPEVGETVLVQVGPYGAHVISSDMQVAAGSDILVLEVKAVKKVKLSIE